MRSSVPWSWPSDTEKSFVYFQVMVFAPEGMLIDFRWVKTSPEISSISVELSVTERESKNCSLDTDQSK